MNIKIIKSNIVANLSTGFHWSEWSAEEQDLFTLLFFEKGFSSEDEFRYQRRSLMRRLFNRLDVVEPPAFIKNHLKLVKDLKKYESEITLARELILSKGIVRAGNLPPIY